MAEELVIIEAAAKKVDGPKAPPVIAFDEWAVYFVWGHGPHWVFDSANTSEHIAQAAAKRRLAEGSRHVYVVHTHLPAIPAEGGKDRT